MQHIALVGLPGSGKTSVGRRLAQALGQPFIDTDLLIEQRLGCSVREYFERVGESGFRDIEQSVIAELGESPAGVVATGGGAVLRPANRAVLRNAFHVVYLQSSPEDLYRRLQHDTKRPLLQVQDPLGRLRELHAERDPLYRELAHATVATGRASIAASVKAIMAGLPAG